MSGRNIDLLLLCMFEVFYNNTWFTGSEGKSVIEDPEDERVELE